MNLNIVRFPDALVTKLKMKAIVDKTTLRDLVIALLEKAVK